jgi:hypothetical protein
LVSPIALKIDAPKLYSKEKIIPEKESEIQQADATIQKLGEEIAIAQAQLEEKKGE